MNKTTQTLIFYIKYSFFFFFLFHFTKIIPMFLNINSDHFFFHCMELIIRDDYSVLT